MTVDKMIEHLIGLSDEGYGNLKMYSCHGSSGACDEMSGGHVTQASEMDIGMGLDLEEGQEYVSVYIGN